MSRSYRTPIIYRPKNVRIEEAAQPVIPGPTLKDLTYFHREAIVRHLAPYWNEMIIASGIDRDMVMRKVQSDSDDQRIMWAVLRVWTDMNGNIKDLKKFLTEHYPLIWQRIKTDAVL